MVDTMTEKSEAQIKNETEVRRIMEERGYSSASSKKQVKKAFGRSFSFKPLIVFVFAIGIIIGGWLFLQNNPFWHEQNDNLFDKEAVAEQSEELTAFRACIGAVDTSEIALSDNEFWNKYIERYEQQLACYEKYPSAVSSTEKSDLEAQLSQAKENSQNAEANDISFRQSEAEADRRYQETLAQIQTEYEQNRAALDAETAKKLEEYDRQRDERNAQYEAERVAREEKQAKCNTFKSDYPDVETYRAKNGNLEALKNAYESAKSAYYADVNSYPVNAAGNHSAEYMAMLQKSLDDKKAAMNTAYSNWNSAYTSLTSTYNAKYREACL